MHQHFTLACSGLRDGRSMSTQFICFTSVNHLQSDLWLTPPKYHIVTRKRGENTAGDTPRSWPTRPSKLRHTGADWRSSLDRTRGDAAHCWVSETVHNVDASHRSESAVFWVAGKTAPQRSPMETSLQTVWCDYFGWQGGHRGASRIPRCWKGENHRAFWIFCPCFVSKKLVHVYSTALA